MGLTSSSSGAFNGRNSTFCVLTIFRLSTPLLMAISRIRYIPWAFRHPSRRANDGGRQAAGHLIGLPLSLQDVSSGNCNANGMIPSWPEKGSSFGLSRRLRDRIVACCWKSCIKNVTPAQTFGMIKDICTVWRIRAIPAVPCAKVSSR